MRAHEAESFGAIGAEGGGVEFDGAVGVQQVVAPAGLRGVGRITELDAGAGVPAREAGWAVVVVVEEEVLDGVLLAAAPSIQVRRGERMHPRGMLLRALPPFAGAELNHLHRLDATASPRHATSTRAPR